MKRDLVQRPYVRLSPALRLFCGALAIALAAACGASPSSATADGGGAGESDAAPDRTSSVDGGSSDAAGAPGDAASRDSADAQATQPAMPVLTNAMGGPVLKAPKVAFIVYPGYPHEATLQAFAQKVAGSSYWSTTTSEYGVGALTYAGTTDLTGQTAPATIKSTDVASSFSAALAKGTFGAPDSETIYTLVYPQGTTITQPNPVLGLLPDVQSCVDFDGYHDNVVVDGKNYAYAVIATCSGDADAVTATVSHEWIEAATDPYLTSNGTFTLQGGPQSAFFNVDGNHVIWALLASGGEAGDLCQPQGPAIYFTPAEIGYEVQRTWSNASAVAGHDPCVPLIGGQTYFRSAAVLTETVVLHSFITGNVTTQGITIPIGQSRTVDVVLYADGDTGGPWTVSAEDLLYKSFGAASGGLIQRTLAFQWDKPEGKSGDTLHLTISVTAASALGNGHAFVITSESAGRVTAWPGLIVDAP